MNNAAAKITKRVAYSYPSSPNACRFKFPAGCWTVETVEYNPDMQPPVAVKGFAKFSEAQKHAESLPYPFDRFTYNPEWFAIPLD